MNWGKCTLVSKNVPFYYNLISSSRLRFIVNRLHLVCGCNEHFLQASKIEQGWFFSVNWNNFSHSELYNTFFNSIKEILIVEMLSTEFLVNIERFHCAWLITWPAAWEIHWTKENICIRKRFNSHRIGLGHQHGRHFTILGHQYVGHDVMWKRSVGYI